MKIIIKYIQEFKYLSKLFYLNLLRLFWLIIVNQNNFEIKKVINGKTILERFF